MKKINVGIAGYSFGKKVHLQALRESSTLQPLFFYHPNESKCLKIEKETFLITRNFPSGKQQSWNLEPYWASVELNSQKRNEENLILKSKDKVVLVGSFLNYNDKRKLFDRIQEAINLYKKK